ncbi:MAG: TetR/AcrR family transcriptional regulator, partial [Desulfobacteraceae bacterium]|nr:TetR/AcrR family transcriptional regulator [Desulfobacteraceae bacterium]
MNKGKETKKKIMDMGFELASTLGLECLSIGTLAKATSMSKSGLFGHFNSKENLQLAVMKHAGGIFRNEVIIPALKTERGIPRIKK